MYEFTLLKVEELKKDKSLAIKVYFKKWKQL